MGVAADDLARVAGVGRDRQDRYAARSHAAAYAAQQAGGFRDELVAVGGVDSDERPRPGLTVDRLARLPPLHADGTVTAGNSCGINDGAAVVAVVDPATHRRLDRPALRIRAVATAGVDPRLPGRGLVPAVRLALGRARVGLDDLDVIEFNEAFAGQILACCDGLRLDEGRVCVEGGALALGHPWGASGAVLAVRLFSQMVWRGRGALGLAAIAAGGGQGVAMVVEACP
jgi:acetyl-CoA C-acetyltransferase